MPMHECWAVLLAAGQGSRMQVVTHGQAKQFLTWQGAPLWWASARALAASPLVHGVVLVFPAEQLDDAHAALRRLDKAKPLGVPWRVCSGGERRQDSVRLGLELVPPSCVSVLVHDSARPFVSTALVSRVVQAVSDALPDTSWGGIIPGIAVTDTIKETKQTLPLIPESHTENQAKNSTLCVARTPDRSSLRAAQTPQAFPFGLLRHAHDMAEKNGWQATDDASLMEQCGYSILVIEGDPNNIKITSPEDLPMLSCAPSLHGAPPYWPCTGYGYDVHRYGGNRPLVLGGVPIADGGFAVTAHSDGDVLLHALIDAILGCMAAGDIGQHFPDSDPAFAGISSALLLDRVMAKAAESGLRITHVDLTMVAQKPKLAPHAMTIRRNVARLLALPEQHVNFKSTTEEGLGFTGQEQGLKAVALVTGLRQA